MSEVDKEISALARISLPTWAIIFTLIATIVGWGVTTLANSKTNDQQDVKIESKVDKDEVNRKFDDLIKRIEDLKEDIREIREAQREDANLHHRSQGN